MSLPIIDTRPLFRPLTREIVSLERRLAPADWERPTIAGRWRVRDVATHLLDTAFDDCRSNATDTSLRHHRSERPTISSR